MILATAIILILILIFVSILVVPFNILLKLKISDFQTRNDQLRDIDIKGFKTIGYFKLTWMKIRLFKKEFPDGEVKDKKVNKADNKDKEQKFNIKKLPKIISLLYDSLPYLMRIFKAFLKSTTFQKFDLKLRLGLGSPYDTVVVSGYLYSIIAMMNIIPRVNLYLEPDFQKGRLEASINLKIKIKLLWIVLELLRAFTKKPVRTLLNELRKMRQ